MVEPVTDTPEVAAGELELAASFVTGNRDAHSLVDHWIRQVVLLPSWHFTEDCEDIVSIVMLKLLANLQARKFRGESTFRTYVQRIARYTCIDQVRGQRVQRGIDPEELPLASPPKTPEQIELEQERRRLFFKIFRAVSPECQRLWRMICSDCLTYKQIGEQLKIPEGSVKRKVHECKNAAIALKDKLV
jgi:RNA polymerase sigma factor (sigma-70 family)